MSERKALKPGMNTEKLSALELLSREMETGRRTKVQEEVFPLKKDSENSEMEIEDYENIDDMKNFIEGEIAYDDEEFSEDEEKNIKKPQQLPSQSNNLFKYAMKKKTATPKPSIAQKKSDISAEKSKEMLSSLMEKMFDEKESVNFDSGITIENDPKFLYKSKLEKEKDLYDISLKNFNSSKQKRDFPLPNTNKELQVIEEKENNLKAKRGQDEIAYEEENSLGDLEDIDKEIEKAEQMSSAKKKFDKEEQFVPHYFEDQEFTKLSNSSQKPFFGSLSQSVNIKDIMNEDGNIDFYWFDAFEDSINSPGIVFMFGKVMNKATQQFINATVEVKNIWRKIFFVPNFDLPLSQDELIEKLQEEVEEFRQTKFKGAFEWKKRVVELDYAFELDIATGIRKYIEVQYAFSSPQLIPSCSGKYFKCIVGTSYSALEIFLIQQEIKGPQWLVVKNYQTTKSFHNKDAMAFIIDDKRNISPSNENYADPPMNILAISSCSSKLSVSKENEIISIGCLYKGNINVAEEEQSKTESAYFFSISRETVKKQIQIKNNTNVKTEYELIENFIKTVAKLDPDVIIAHDIYSNLFDLLISRMQKNRIKSGSHLSRLPGRDYFKEKGLMARIRSITVGRLLADSYLSSRDIVRESDYSLTNLAKKYLNKERIEMDSESIREIFVGGISEKMKEIVHSVNYDAFLSFSLIKSFQILPLTLQLTKIAGNLWIRSLQNSRAERNELLLMHEFHKKKFLIPDKNFLKQDEKMFIEGEEKVIKKKQKAKYSGGLVLEPKSGFYENIILLLDFNSLYPSIIQEFNICFTTVNRSRNASSKEKEEINLEEDGNVEVLDSVPGILPQIIKSLVDRRKQVKNLLRNEKNPQKQMMLDIRQKAIKLIANSIYGCLGFSNSRFFAQPIAALITKKGREILEKSVKYVNDVLGYEVVYGDTDSMMVNSNMSHLGDAIKVGASIKKEINKHYKCLEIEIDGVFKVPYLNLASVAFEEKEICSKKIGKLG